MPTRYFPIIVIVGVALLVALTSLFTVSETQLAVRTQFGAIVGENYPPGLHWKLPWDKIVRFERRVMSQSYSGETFLTNDNRALTVDFYTKWRVEDAARYFQATGGQEITASERLGAIVKNGLKSVMAQRTLEQIVTSERAAVTGDMFGNASREAGALGINLIDVRVRSIDLPDEVSARVYESMKQNFEKIARRLRAEGSSAAARIRAEAERQRTEILSAAERDALKVRGAADAEASGIYARVYSRYPEFFAFYRSLQAYERSLGNEGDLMVVTPDGDFFKYLKSPDRQ